MVSQTKLQSTHIMARERVSLTASELLAGLTLGKTQIFDPTIFLRTIELWQGLCYCAICSNGTSANKQLRPSGVYR